MAGLWGGKGLRVLVSVLAIGSGALLAIRPFAAVEILALASALGLVAGALVQLVQAERESPGRLILAGGYLVGAGLIAWWPGMNLLGISVVVGGLLIAAGAVDLWSGAQANRTGLPKLLVEASVAQWASVLAGAVTIGLGVVAMLWLDVTLLPVAIAQGIALLLAAGALIADTWFPQTVYGAQPDRPRLAGRLLALAVAVALVVVGIWIDQGRVAPTVFYSSASVSNHDPGKLLRAESYTYQVPTGVAAARMLYVTSDLDGRTVQASAVIYVPASRIGQQLPLVVWAHGTTGMAASCAPSVDGLETGSMNVLGQIMDAGYALLAPDIAGLGTTGEHPYLIGLGEGRSILDGIRAARQVSGIRLGDALLWGFSQGGHAVLWAAQLQPQYAPELRLVGVAAFAPAADLSALFGQGTKGLGTTMYDAYLADAYSVAYPDVGFDIYIRSDARLLVREAAARCLDRPGPLLSWAATVLNGGSIWQIPPTQGALGTRLVENTPAGAIAVPVLIAQGSGDIMVPKAVQDAYVAKRCQTGQSVDYRVYPGRDHGTLVASDSPAITEALAWSAERFAGASTAGNCG